VLKYGLVLQPDLMLIVRLRLTRGSCWPALELMLSILPILNIKNYRDSLMGFEEKK
jgi:hypothetical protein